MADIILCLLVFANVDLIGASEFGSSKLEVDPKIGIVDIETILNVQSEQIKVLTKTVHDHNMEIINLKHKVQKLENKVDDNKMRISNLGKILKRRVKPVDRGIRMKPVDRGSGIEENNNQRTNDQLSKQDEQTKKNVHSIIRKERLLVGNNESGKMIGFYAYIDHRELIGEHKVMVFNIAKTNIGHGYSIHSGVFTAPIVGLYGFSVSLFPSHMAAGSFDILVNDDVEGVLFTDSDTNSWDLSSSSMTIVVILKQGDEVFIRSRAGYKNVGTIEGSEYAKSTFAGWLISA